MDIAFSDDDKAFQSEVREFLDATLDDELRRLGSQTKNGYLTREAMVRWHKVLAAKGWVAPHWPVEHGGPGWSPTQRYIFDLECAALGTPLLSPMGIRMVAPVIMAFGTEVQKKQHLPPIHAGDTWWCQGYSEPGSGSDLASLQMKAEDKGDYYLCNGTKTWTTHAQWADWMFCLVRTNPDAPKKQAGISFILIDMKTPGITVKPIISLDGPVEGAQEINEVFFDDVKVPKENRIGEENMGWTYAKYLLEFERGNTHAPRLKRAIAKLRKIAAAEQDGYGGRLLDDGDFRARIDALEIAATALEFTELRIFSDLAGGQNPGAKSSILKTRGTELQQQISELLVEAVGAYAQPFVADTFAISNQPRPGPDYAAPIAPAYFNYRKASIYAGSNEIQRNIMAKLVLGL